MNQFLQKIFLDNTIQSYLIVLGTILLALLIKKIISKYLAGVLHNMITRAGKKINRQSFFELLVAPLEVFLLLFISYVAVDKLNYPTAFEFNIFKYSSKLILNCIANIALVMAFIWLCLRVIDFIALVLEEKANLTHDVTDNQLIVFFKDFFKVILVIIGVLMVLHFAFNRDVSNLLTGLSLVGAAIALATRESLENLIASFIIFFDKPFTTGDVVKVQNFTGTVEKIGLRSTRIRTDSKTYISVPNKQMVDSIIDNISLRTQRKGEVRLEIDLQTTTQQLLTAEEKIKLFLDQQKDLDSYSVFITETGKTAHVISIEFYCSVQQSMEEFNNTKQKINLACTNVLQELNISWAVTQLSSVYK